MFLDTSVIVELMLGDDDRRIDIILKHINDELIFISIVQLGEINDWCLANCADSETRITQLKEIVHLIPLNDSICVEASNIKRQMRSQKIAKFSLIDGIILASARHIGQTLLSLDSDFRKAEGAVIIR
ncbi:MAG: PIN domain-containing protein [Candidatus Thermoplasmatota archaeon]|nr:PIN domain-containing protein [Euryarchaeota archaeon]MBU4031691.1 PIN domain-containing protein [Candidatus Thermoplasmatota archaeon]MBU4071349.1 PIN domain-containing protein [Candidatus Thermoplasmatota archaeon]MBU4144625.1 PIN domain-containing protein [Candidatus Thermoplasmatota archaeon]MBU4592385.1 PIN domain-containing protein [Candidatus Thermoplasmatota archaeon]